MILIYSPKITNRLKYTASLLLDGLCSISVEITDNQNDFLNFVGPKINYSQTPITAEEIFIYSNGLLNQKGIKFFKPDVKFVNQIPLIFVSPSNHCSFGFDLFAASFYFVSRYEEYLPYKGDAHGRFEADQSLAFQNGFLEVPVVNIYAEMLVGEISKKNKVDKPAVSSFKFLPTYDIDNAYAYKGKGFFRSLAASIRSLFSLNFDVFFERLNVLRGNKPDPFDTFDYQIYLQKKYNLKPIYFFLAGDYGPFDKNIYVFSRSFESIVKKTDDYALIGLHPSYASYNNPRRLSMEVSRFAKIANQPIIRCRLHFIRLSFPLTYKLLLENNVYNDYTMGYATHTGFRASICSPYYFYDLEGEQITKLKIHPFTAMDMTLNKYMKLSADAAEKKLSDLINIVKSVNGNFVSVWHNDSLSERGIWAGWRKVYESMLANASMKSYD